MPRYWVSVPIFLFCRRGEKEKEDGRERMGIADMARFSMAYTEIYLTIARIVRSFDMDLYETTREDVEIYHARVVGYPKKVKGQVEGRGETKIKVTRRAG